MLHHLAARALTWRIRLASSTSQWIRRRTTGGDRGDISITTVIIWVAAVAAALLIAGTIGVVATKYNGKLTGI